MALCLLPYAEGNWRARDEGGRHARTRLPVCQWFEDRVRQHELSHLLGQTANHTRQQPHIAALALVRFESVCRGLTTPFSQEQRLLWEYHGRRKHGLFLTISLVQACNPAVWVGHQQYSWDARGKRHLAEIKLQADHLFQPVVQPTFPTSVDVSTLLEQQRLRRQRFQDTPSHQHKKSRGFMSISIVKGLGLAAEGVTQLCILVVHSCRVAGAAAPQS